MSRSTHKLMPNRSGFKYPPRYIASPNGDDALRKAHAWLREGDWAIPPHQIKVYTRSSVPFDDGRFVIYVGTAVPGLGEEHSHYDMRTER